MGSQTGIHIETLGWYTNTRRYIHRWLIFIDIFLQPQSPSFSAKSLERLWDQALGDQSAKRGGSSFGSNQSALTLTVYRRSSVYSLPPGKPGWTTSLRPARYPGLRATRWLDTAWRHARSKSRASCHAPIAASITAEPRLTAFCQRSSKRSRSQATPVDRISHHGAAACPPADVR